eukprot:363542-Chlamydomonas_euryale.AAC.9
MLWDLPLVIWLCWMGWRSLTHGIRVYAGPHSALQRDGADHRIDAPTRKYTSGWRIAVSADYLAWHRFARSVAVQHRTR